MKSHLNYYLLLAVGILLLLGVLFLATLSSPLSLNRFGTTNYYLFHQLFFGILPALIAGIIVYFLPLEFLKKFAVVLLLTNIGLLALVFLPFFGIKLLGAQRWLNFGFFGFQPSEFLKITSVLYLSALMSCKFSEGKKSGFASKAKSGFYNLKEVFLPFFLLITVVAAILFFQRDASTMGIILLTLLIVYFASKTPIWHTLLIGFFGALGFFLLIKFTPYRMQRFLVFLNPEADPLGVGYHLKQSIIAVGSGGIFGKGLGMSTQKFGYLPQAMSDSIFAIMAEETGILGSLALIGLFLFFIWQGVRIAKNAKDKFSQLTAVGITFWIGLQALINIGSCIGIVPLSGVPLPFISSGGSHLLTELIGVGLLLNISKKS